MTETGYTLTEPGRPILKPVIVSAHRGGGQVMAPDNSMPNIEYAARIGVTAIELDLRLTKDGHIVLWHDSSIPKRFVSPGAEVDGRVGLIHLALKEIQEIRYDAEVGDHRYKGLRILTLDEVVEKFKGKLNFHLDTKSMPVDKVLEAIHKHGIWDTVLVMSSDMDRLKAIEGADPRIRLEFPHNTLGREEIDGRWVYLPIEKQLEQFRETLKRLSYIGIDALCTKGLTQEKVSLCHEYGIAVRESAAHVDKESSGERYLRMGVDLILCDAPEKVLQAVLEIYGADYLSRPEETIDQIFGTRTETAINH